MKAAKKRIGLMVGAFGLVACSGGGSGSGSIPVDPEEPQAIDSDYESTTPKYLMINKSSETLGRFFLSDQCHVLILSFKNSSGRDIATPSSVTVKISDTSEKSDYPNEPQFTDKASFATKADCVGNIGASVSFVIPAGTRETTRWIKIPPTDLGTRSYVDRYFRVTTNRSNLKVGHLSVTNNRYGYWPITSTLYGAYEFLGPVKVIQGQCYKYRVSFSDFNGTPRSLSEKTYSFSNISTGVSISSDPNCQTNIKLDKKLSFETIYIRYDVAPGTTRLPPAITSSPFSSTSILVSLEVYVFPDGTESQVELLGASDIPRAACAGPYMLVTSNQYGAALANGTGGAKNVSFSSSSIGVYSDKNCANSLGTSGTISLAAGDTGTVVYLKTASSVLSQTISFTSAAGTGTKRIYLND